MSPALSTFLDIARIAGLSLLVPAFIWLAWELWGDPARGRRRCPHCWYDMSKAAGGGGGALLCPECGRDARREKRLFKTRRSRLRSTLAVLLLFFCLAASVASTLVNINWIQAAPTRALIWYWPIADRDPDPTLAMRLQEELRTRTYTLSQFHALARACAGIWADGKQTAGDQFASQVLSSAEVVVPDRIALGDNTSIDPSGQFPAREERLALKALGPKAADLVPDLAVALHDPQRGDQMTTLGVLTILAPACPAAFDIALDRFKTKHEHWVGSALANRFGPGILARLKPMLHDRDPDVRRDALQVVLEMDRASRDVRAALLEVLDDAGPDLVFTLIRAITLPADATEQIPVLRPLLKVAATGVSLGEDNTRPADELLKSIPIPRDPAITTHLRTLLSDSNPSVHTMAGALLLRSGPDDNAAATLLSAISDPDTRIRDLACCCYSALDSAPPEALARAAKLVTDSDQFTRASAARLLRAHAALQAACDALAAALAHERPAIREFAADQLRLMRAAAAAALPALHLAESDSNPLVRKAVARAIRDISRQPDQPLSPDELVADKLDTAERTNSIVSALATFLQDPDPAVRAAAVKQLSRLNSSPNPNYNELARAMGSTDAATRDAIWTHLSAHADPRLFLSLLFPLFHHPDTEVRLFAATHARDVPDRAKQAMISQLQSFLRSEQSPKVKDALQKSLDALTQPPTP